MSIRPAFSFIALTVVVVVVVVVCGRVGCVGLFKKGFDKVEVGLSVTGTDCGLVQQTTGSPCMLRVPQARCKAKIYCCAYC